MLLRSKKERRPPSCWDNKRSRPTTSPPPPPTPIFSNLSFLPTNLQSLTSPSHTQHNSTHRHHHAPLIEHAHQPPHIHPPRPRTHILSIPSPPLPLLFLLPGPLHRRTTSLRHPGAQRRRGGHHPSSARGLRALRPLCRRARGNLVRATGDGQRPHHGRVPPHESGHQLRLQ